MSEYPVAVQLCGHCGYAFNRVVVPPDQTPNPPANGDISLCLNCGMANVYDTGTWHLLTTEEYPWALERREAYLGATASASCRR